MEIENTKIYKWNYYSMIIEIDQGILIYSSHTGEIIKIVNDTYREFILKLSNMNKICISNNFNSSEMELIEVLINKKIIIDFETDEYSLVSYIFNNKIVNSSILELTLVVSRQCNFRCVYCYEEHLDLCMSDEVYNDILKLIDNVLSTGQYNGISIALFGGEPFLEYDRLIVFLKKAYQIATGYNRMFEVSATTNGSLLFPERFLELYNVNCRHFQITLDGLKHTHDMYRIPMDGNDWDVIINNLKFMASTDKKFDVTIRTNFNDEILNSIEKFYEYISKTFDERFNIYYEGIKRLGGANDENVNTLDNISAGISTIEIAEVLKKYKLKSNVCTERIMPFHHICQATKYNAFIIDYNGVIMKCTLDFNNSDNQIGYLGHDGQMYIDHEKHCKWLTVGFENNDQCKACKLLPLCFGRSCVSDAIHNKKVNCDGNIETIFLMEQLKKYYG